MRIVNYLDLTLNLANGTYRPYHKPYNIINYTSTNSLTIHQISSRKSPSQSKQDFQHVMQRRSIQRISSILRSRSSKIWVQPQIKVPTTPTPATTSYTQQTENVRSSSSIHHTTKTSLQTSANSSSTSFKHTSLKSTNSTKYSTKTTSSLVTAAYPTSTPSSTHTTTK